MWVLRSFFGTRSLPIPTIAPSIKIFFHYSLTLSHAQLNHPHPSCSYPHIFTPVHTPLAPSLPRTSHLLPLLREIHAFLLGSPELWVVAWLSFALHLIFAYEWVHNHVCLSGSGLPHSGWFFSSSVQLPAYFMISLYFFSGIIFHCVDVPYYFIIRSSVKGNLGCFQVLAIMNNATINIFEQVFLWCDWVSFGYMSLGGIAGS